MVKKEDIRKVMRELGSRKTPRKIESALANLEKGRPKSGRRRACRQCGEKMSKVETDLWYCPRCDVRYRLVTKEIHVPKIVRELQKVE
jgi:ribosomal protein L37AE/L43A